MKKFIKVCLIICAILGFVGLGSMLAGAMLGGNWNVFHGPILEIGWFDHDDDDDDDVYDWFVDEDFAERSEFKQTTDTQSYTRDEVQRLDIEIQAGELEILPSEDESIYVELGNENNKAVLDHDRLHIHSGKAVQNNVICVYLPEGVQLQEVDIEVAAGSASIENLSANEVDLEIGLGSLICNGTITAQKVSCDVGAGDAEFSRVDAKSIELDCGMGEIIAELEGPEADYRGHLECSMGDLSYGEAEYSGMAVSQNVGTDGRRKIEAECDMGSLTIIFTE
ncbi:MAG: DUF4097 family beta strand repeat-containing protein [Lachnospiraceae bacterium]|jgi:hypothetical protein